MTFKKGDKVFVEFEVLDMCHSSEYMLVKDKSNQTRQFLKSEAQVLPKKVVIPKFVADLIEKRKERHVEWNNDAKNWFIFDSISDLTRFDYDIPNFVVDIDSRIYEWVLNHKSDFILAILYGYEIKQEQLYTVQIPNPNIDKEYATVLKRKEDNTIELCVFVRPNFSEEKFKLTESEIKQDFDWAWRWAKPVEE